MKSLINPCYAVFRAGVCCAVECDYYETLGVPKNASQDDIKKAFHAVGFPVSKYFLWTR